MLLSQIEGHYFCIMNTQKYMYSDDSAVKYWLDHSGPASTWDLLLIQK